MQHALNRRNYQGQAKILVWKLITRKGNARNLKERKKEMALFSACTCSV